MSADGAAEVLTPLHVGELVIDGGTLGHILGTDAEQELAAVGAQCGSVVICRSSPSQKAAVVRMMAEYEMRQVCPLPTFSPHPFPLHHMYSSGIIEGSYTESVRSVQKAQLPSRGL